MTFRLPIARLSLHAPGRREGFTAAVLAAFPREGDELLVEPNEWRRIAREHSAQAALPHEPTVAEIAENFAAAMGRWSAAGFPTVTRETYEARAATCDSCEHWDGAARVGLGKCNAPGCGCTKFKRWLQTERCPLNKWEET